MLPEIKRVRDEDVKLRNTQELDIQRLVNIFEMCSSIDEVEYIGYDVPNTNPIWGRFSKWDSTVPYSRSKTYCKVQYACHLDEIWKLFVVCKELCHSLHTNNGTHSVTDNAVVELVNTLSLSSAISESDVHKINPFVAEKLAEFGALEIIVPVGVRQRMLQSGAYSKSADRSELSKALSCPQCYIDFIFSQSIIDFSLKVL